MKLNETKKKNDDVKSRFSNYSQRVSRRMNWRSLPGEKLSSWSWTSSIGFHNKKADSIWVRFEHSFAIHNCL